MAPPDTNIVTLSERQNRLLNAVKEVHRRKREKLNIEYREVAKMYNVTPSKLHIAARGEATEKAILGLSFGRGRAVRLTNEEEKLIVDATLEFQQNCIPLDCRSFRKLARTLIRTLSAPRRDKLGFKNDLPGIDWQKAFIKRHPQLTLRRRVNLEHERSEAMNP